METTAIPQWFSNTILTGLQRLLCLALDGAPADDFVSATAAVWVDALWTQREWSEVDVDSVARGFRELAGAARRWPPPRQLLDYLPPPRTLAAPYHAPARKPRLRALTSDANRARIDALLADCAARLNAGGGNGT